MARVRFWDRCRVVDTSANDLGKWWENLSAGRCLELCALKLELGREECAGGASGGRCEDLAESRGTESRGGHGCGGGSGEGGSVQCDSKVVVMHMPCDADMAEQPGIIANYKQRLIGWQCQDDMNVLH